MVHETVNPTLDIYSRIQKISEQFNVALFEGQLPPVIFTLQRGKKSSGYFSPARWRHIEGELVGEISVNPIYFANRPIIHLFQTIVHEQCHVWQHTFGNPSRPGYHNGEWAEKMLKIGLMPSDTGEPGGRKTGQKMSDYVITGGRFIETCEHLMGQDDFLPWIDLGAEKDAVYHRTLPGKSVNLTSDCSKLDIALGSFFPGFDAQNDSLRNVAHKRKIRYCCPMCSTNVWGKSGLKIDCAVCDVKFEELPTSL
ncbi:SprT-like domain-containing protein [Undibacterium sp. Di27W]|uniref:SprT-like domain-containing protein n=1 Tax=Undibacterium sp. Di27W TaxID=3413036 RepID=UPI003BF33EB0